MKKCERDRSGGETDAAEIVAALGDPAGWPMAAPGFDGRCLAAVRASASRCRPSVRWRFGKTAAVLAVTASLAGYAAYLGVSALSGGDETDGNATGVRETVSSTGSLEELLNEGENTMVARKLSGIVGAALVSVSVSAAKLSSEPTLVFLRPETSSFWNTATNNIMTVPVDFPSGATVATLTVSGLNYKKVYDGIVNGEFRLELPEAESPQTENVYDLELTFDDGTRRTAKLGLIQGRLPGAAGSTRCLAPANGRVWERVNGRAVLPIPCGTTSFSVTVNGKTVSSDTGLGGAQGWYALGVRNGDVVTLSMLADGLSSSASLYGALGGIMLIVK